MRVVIFGAGIGGDNCISQIDNFSQNIEIVDVIDNIKSGMFHGYNIKKPNEVLGNKGKYDSVIITAGSQKALCSMIATCEIYKVENIYMQHDVVGKCRLPIFENGKFIPTRIRKLKFSTEKPSLHYFEVPITDNCNLNCAGCLFASNIMTNPEHVPTEELKKDARRMAELFFDIPWIRILGGEPLLHPGLTEVLAEYRKCFPDSEIDLCTNGILLPKMNERFWNCVKENRISIHVSGYKPTYNMLNKIDLLLKHHRVPYVVLKRDTFLKYYTDKPIHDIQKNYRACVASSCYEIYRGRAFTCSAVIAFKHFNDIFGANYRVAENEDWLDIHTEEVDGFQVKKVLSTPSGVCKYCDVENMKQFDWKVSAKNIKLQEFLLEKW